MSAIETDSATSNRMRNVRQAGTRPERLVRAWLTSQGVRYRCNNRSLPGSPDLANKKRRWAVFVHGCFWHGHAGCGRATTPKNNAAFWREKITGNKRRDLLKQEALQGLGYDVIVIWECEAELLARSVSVKRLGDIRERLVACTTNPPRPPRRPRQSLRLR